MDPGPLNNQEKSSIESEELPVLAPIVKKVVEPSVNAQSPFVIMESEPLLHNQEISSVESQKVPVLARMVKEVVDEPLESLAIATTTPPPAPATASSSPKELAGSRLHQQGQTQLQKLESKRNETPDECTFMPLVNRTSSFSTKVATPEGTDRFSQLYEKGLATEKKKEDAIKKKSLEKKYSFKPKINVTTPSKKKQSSSASPTSRYDKLYQQGLDRQAKQTAALAARQKEEGCTFSPAINKSRNKSTPESARASLYDKKAMLLRRESMEKIRLEKELESCTFQPKLIKSSVKTPTRRKQSTFDRLSADGKKRQESIERRRAEQEQREMEGATFRPNITASTTGMSRQKGTLFERLYNGKNRSEVVAKQEAKKREEEQKLCTFKPHTNHKGTTIRKKNSESIFDRLYKENEKKIAVKQERESQRLENEIRSCTFAPEVSTSSHTTHGGSKIWERLLVVDKSGALQEREKQKIEAELKECTFKPHITEASAADSARVGSKKNIFDRLSSAKALPEVKDDSKVVGVKKKVNTAADPINNNNSKDEVKSESVLDKKQQVSESVKETYDNNCLPNNNLDANPEEGVDAPLQSLVKDEVILTEAISEQNNSDV